MNRKIVATGVLLTGLLVAMPVLAQNHVWTSDRPDGHAPAGVKSDFLLSFGELYIGYRHTAEKFRGARSSAPRRCPELRSWISSPSRR